jgi:hypothetical protein
VNPHGYVIYPLYFVFSCCFFLLMGKNKKGLTLASAPAAGDAGANPSRCPSLRVPPAALPPERVASNSRGT